MLGNHEEQWDSSLFMVSAHCENELLAKFLASTVPTSLRLRKSVR